MQINLNIFMVCIFILAGFLGLIKEIGVRNLGQNPFIRSTGPYGFMALGQEAAAEFKLLRIFSVR